MWWSPSKWLGVRFSLFLPVLFSTPLWAQAVLENPLPGSFQSGIGVISGWKCTATQIAFLIDGRVTVQAAYGTIRGDTQQPCGDTNNGFGLLVNWNVLGDGQHTLVAKADGVEFARATFTVTTFGVDFLKGASGQFHLPGFPTPGKDVTVQWQESTQSFVVTGVTSSGTPFPNSIQVRGIEEHLCSDQSRNEIVTFSGTLSGSPTSSIVQLMSDTGVEVDATLSGIQTVSGVVVGNFTAQSRVNGSTTSEGQGSFHGILTDPTINLTYFTLLSTSGCNAFGTLSGSR